MRRHTSHYASESCPEDVHHCSGPECTKSKSKDSRHRASDLFALCERRVRRRDSRGRAQARTLCRPGDVPERTIKERTVPSRFPNGRFGRRPPSGTESSSDMEEAPQVLLVGGGDECAGRCARKRRRTRLSEQSTEGKRLCPSVPLRIMWWSPERLHMPLCPERRRFRLGIVPTCHPATPVRLCQRVPC